MTERKARPFARLFHDVVDSTAVAAASTGAKALLLLLTRRHNGKNEIVCSVREAAAWCHCGKSTAATYFKELNGLGLIEPVRLGHFQIKAGDLKNAATTWRLTFDL
jgi:hypothetical protein